MYIFNNTPQENMDEFMKRIHEATPEAPNARDYVHHALVCLIGLHISMSESSTEVKESNELKLFYEKSTQELAKFWRNINAYADITCFIAEGANDDEWYELCIRRSILYILVNDYKDTEVMKYIELNDIEELDVELKRVGLEQGPISANFIPRGLGKEHWWWYYPN